MVKRVGVFSLTEGKDPDETWKYWVETHATNVAKLPSIRKYIINRIAKVVKGETKFWGIVELWFDNEEAYDKAFALHTGDEFSTMITEPRFSAWVEEKVIV